MTPQEAGALLSPTHRGALRAAYRILEQPDFAARLSEAAGRPVNQLLKLSPGVERRVMRTVERALRQAAGAAARSLEPTGGRGNASLALAGASRKTWLIGRPAASESHFTKSDCSRIK